MSHGAQRRAFEETEVFCGLRVRLEPSQWTWGSGIQTGILDFGHLNLMLLDLLIKRAAGYT